MLMMMMMMMMVIGRVEREIQSKWVREIWVKTVI